MEASIRTKCTRVRLWRLLRALKPAKINNKYALKYVMQQTLFYPTPVYLVHVQGRRKNQRPSKTASKIELPINCIHRQHYCCTRAPTIHHQHLQSFHQELHHNDYKIKRWQISPILNVIHQVNFVGAAPRGMVKPLLYKGVLWAVVVSLYSSHHPLCWLPSCFEILLKFPGFIVDNNLDNLKKADAIDTFKNSAMLHIPNKRVTSLSSKDLMWCDMFVALANKRVLTLIVNDEAHLTRFDNCNSPSRFCCGVLPTPATLVA